MTEAARSGLRQGLAASLTALAVGFLHIPQPFLAVITATLIAGFPCPTARDGLVRFAAAAAGSAVGVAILVAAPEQQWISLPLFCMATGWGSLFAVRKFGPAAGILYGIGLVSLFSEVLIHPGREMNFGFAHTASLLTATAITAPLASVFLKAKAGRPLPPPGNGAPPTLRAHLFVGTAATLALLASCAFLPGQTTVTTVSAFTAALAISKPGTAPRFGAKLIGGAGGILLSVLFITLVTGSGNDIAILLLGLGAIVGLAEWLAARSSSEVSTAVRQGAATFVIMSTILPAPERFMTSSLERMCAILLGLVVVGIAGIVILKPLPDCESGRPSSE